MNIFRLAAFACFVCLLFVPAGSAQTITGSTTIDIDPDTGNVQVICSTELDDDSAAYYEASVTCTLYGNGTLIQTSSKTDTRGFAGIATVAFIVAGVPGTTYTATGTHKGIIEYLDEEFSDTLNPSQFYDAYNFGFFESPVETYPDTFEWFGPGPPEGRSTSTLETGNTTANQIRYYTPTELSQLITSAQSLFSSQCDAAFASAIGSSYNKINFFESLLATSIIQYPPGATPPPDIGSPLNEPDADTLVNDPGRPIRVFANFYPTAGGFEYPNFQQFVLIHEGVHHYTGWLDFHSTTSPTVPDFVNQFYNSDYRNTSGRTGDFTNWLNAGCPPAP